MNRALGVIVMTGLGLLVRGGVEAGTRENEAAASTADVGIEDFAWMAGYWRGEGLGGVCEEIWSEPLGGSMLGLFRLVREGKVVFSEHMTLGADADGFALKVKHFSPEFVAWEDKEGAVRFPLDEVRPGEAIFNGLRVQRIDEENLEITLRLKRKAGETADEVFRFRRHLVEAAPR